MSKHETFVSKSVSTAEVSGIALAEHLGVSRNRVAAIAARFGLARVDRGFRKFDVLRRIHGIEPMLLQPALVALRDQHSRAIAGVDSAEPETLCMIEELADITDLAQTIWDQGLVHLTDLAPEYGYAYDPFRKKLKSGSINLPPVRPIELSKNRVMYRRLDVVLWHRHGIVLDLPKAVTTSPGRKATSVPEPGKSTLMTAPDTDAMTDAVFATAIAAADEKSGFPAPPDPSADAMHEPRL